MKAVTYQGVKNVEVKEVQDPKIKKADDIIVRLTTTAICGSDLHLIHGMIPNLGQDYVIGHEPMGIVEEVGKDVTKVKRVIGLLFLLILHVVNAGTAITSWKVNVIIPMTMVKWVPTLAIQTLQAVFREDRQSICAFPMEIFSLSKFRKNQKFLMKVSFSLPMLPLLLFGV